MSSSLILLLALIVLLLGAITIYLLRTGWKMIVVAFCLAMLALVMLRQHEFKAAINRWKQLDFMKEEASLRRVVSTFIEEDIKPFVLLDAPLISQLPELPRGCEVTSLAMLLQDAGVKVDKITLAKQVKKDPTPFQRRNGKVYFGNPHDGFVGDMYSLTTPGLGVYHEPIEQLAKKYLPHRIVNLTGSDFSELQKYLSQGSPIWIITNSTFKKLPASAFREWDTPSGPIQITYYEHSVVITGYDKDYIYFNDPLKKTKNQKAPKAEFLDAWVQMGRQAITYQSD
ncbi:peptidase C39 family protein [Anoxybacillus sp. B7M1]|uniref:C39 family peptidase n=1 Tax=unclassified Anoxybacillus TaxID=2639704 RepID=UPI0005CD7CB6|nr:MULTISPECIES: C39 family peptidase [unclassified Anoxybacillus]ANB55915.1 peptidase C39 family protein [Anoxybacillus sp. B2M1]ANB65572.1 peptidase C39 family protein [Anoxybacillus sp. B7M1]